MNQHDAIETPPPSVEKPTNVRWIVFALACGTSWMLYFHRYAFSLVKTFLITEWDVSKEELGYVDSVFSICYAIFQVPAGLIADFLGTRLFLAACIGVWSGAVYGQTLATNTTGLAWALGFSGMAQAGTYPMLNKVSRLWFPSSIRTTLQGWIGVFFGRLGGFSSHLIIMALAIGLFHMPWQSAIRWAALAGLVLMVLFYLFFRDKPRMSSHINEAEIALIEHSTPSPVLTDENLPEGGGVSDAVVPPEKPSIWKVLASRNGLTFVWLMVQTFLSTLADQFFVGWVSLFFKESFKVTPIWLGILAGMPLLGGAVGGVLGGMLNDRLMARGVSRRWARSSVGLMGKGTAGILLAVGVFFFLDNMYAMCVLLVVVKIFCDFSLSSTWGTVTDISGKYSATVFAVNNGMASGAMILMSPIIGKIADAYQGWTEVLLLVAGIFVACALTWLMINAERELFPDENIA
ncbi:MAG: MFS transporter [Planctomycetota bacterium]|nr:MFS transporter [Planctomycetota bacterium]MDA1213353.1 MFS transporter [Planctomycetota bacterium]